MTTSTHEFDLLLRVDADEEAFLDEIGDQLVEAGCDDALLGVDRGVPQAAFDREAPSLPTAIQSAIRDVESVPGVQAVRVGFDELLTASAIADRVGRSRQNVHQWVAGARGPGDFPPPVSWVVGAQVWDWRDVSAWLRDRLGMTDLPPSAEAEFVAAVNGVLAAHEHVQRISVPEEREVVCTLLRRDVAASKGRAGGHVARLSGRDAGGRLDDPNGQPQAQASQASACRLPAVQAEQADRQQEGRSRSRAP